MVNSLKQGLELYTINNLHSEPIFDYGFALYLADSVVYYHFLSLRADSISKQSARLAEFV